MREVKVEPRCQKPSASPRAGVCALERVVSRGSAAKPSDL